MPDIVLIAHGSTDRRTTDDIEFLADAVRNRVRPGRAVGACFLGINSPSPDELAMELGRRAVAVPILLTPVTAARVEFPSAVRRLAAGGTEVRLAPTLGPDPRILDACEELLTAAGIEPDQGTAVVLYAAQCPDGVAVAGITKWLAESPKRLGWGPWAVAALAGGEPLASVAARLREEADRVVAVPFTVADGAHREEMAESCRAAGVSLVGGSLAKTDALAELVVARSG